MTKAEVSKLLTAIFTYERRGAAIGHVDVEAWFPLLKDVDFLEAKAAVEKHFAESDAYLTIARLRSLVREAGKRPAATSSEARRVPNADPDDVATWLQALRRGDWEEERPPGHSLPQGADLGSVGREVPEVTEGEVADDGPRPRRWWLKWLGGSDPNVS